MNIISLSGNDEKTEKENFKRLETKRNDAVASINKKRADLLGINSKATEAKGNDSEKTLNNIGAVQKYGEDLQAKGLSKLLNIEKVLEEDSAKASLIEKQIEDNKKTILRVEDERENMEGALKRVGKHLQYFTRTMASDKLLVCLLFTALAVIIGALVCYFIFGGSKGQNE